MYLLIDIGNTRIKWQHRDQKNIISSNAVLVEDFMDIDLTEIKSLKKVIVSNVCLLYTSPSPRDGLLSRMPSSA